MLGSGPGLVPPAEQSNLFQTLEARATVRKPSCVAPSVPVNGLGDLGFHAFGKLPHHNLVWDSFRECLFEVLNRGKYLGRFNAA